MADDTLQGPVQGVHEYLEEQRVHALLSNAMARIVLERPTNAPARIAELLAEAAPVPPSQPSRTQPEQAPATDVPATSAPESATPRRLSWAQRIFRPSSAKGGSGKARTDNGQQEKLRNT